jgi:microcystin degradation protein MlrC
MAKRVLTARIVHETNTFQPRADRHGAFRANGFFLGNEIPSAYRGTRSTMGSSRGRP